MPSLFLYGSTATCRRIAEGCNVILGARNSKSDPGIDFVRKKCHEIVKDSGDDIAALTILNGIRKWCRELPGEAAETVFLPSSLLQRMRTEHAAAVAIPIIASNPTKGLQETMAEAEKLMLGAIASSGDKLLDTAVTLLKQRYVSDYSKFPPWRGATSFVKYGLELGCTLAAKREPSDKEISFIALLEPRRLDPAVLSARDQRAWRWRAGRPELPLLYPKEQHGPSMFATISGGQEAWDADALACVIREANEEAGLDITALITAARLLSNPAAPCASARVALGFGEDKAGDRYWLRVPDDVILSPSADGETLVCTLPHDKHDITHAVGGGGAAAST